MNKYLRIGILIIFFLVFLALSAPWISPYNPNSQALYEGLTSPTLKHLLGQDRLGRDILSRIIYGTRVSLLVGTIAVFISATAGTFIGSLSGYLGGITDTIIVRLIDIFMAFPGILLAISLMSILGPNLSNVIFALVIRGWVGYARIARSQALSLKKEEFVLAARALGVSPLNIIRRHIVPHLLSSIIVQASFGLAGAVLAEAALSFLGLGVKPPTPSWGAMLSEGRRYLLITPQLTLYPGFALMLMVIGFNLLGEGLREKLSPYTEKK